MNRKDGFTLIEVLVAIVILAVGITAVLQAFHTALVALADSRDVVRADIIIREKMAEVKSFTLEGNEAGMHSLEGRFYGFHDEFEGQLSIKPVPGEIVARGSKGTLYEVSVTVARKKSSKSHSAITYMDCVKEKDLKP